MIELNEQKARAFLKENAIENCNIKKIAGDASFRSYYRIFFGEQTLILMFAPPSHEQINPFINIDKFLIENNFSAPEIFAINEEDGFILLQDFGDETYGRILAQNNSLEENLYQKACDCLIELHKINPPQNIVIYNHDLLFREVMLFVDWYLKYEKKTILTLAQMQHFKLLWFKIFDLLNRENQVLVLRDYHADNLMILKNLQGYKSVGLLDFQDAVIGPKAYDLVSLLEDARRDVSLQSQSKLLKYYLQNSNIDEKLFLQDYEILSLQRNIKIMGIFCRLAYRDNKQDYLKMLPRVKKYIIARINSENKMLAEISEFLKDFI